MRDEVRKALHYQAMVIACGGSEEQANRAYCQALLEFDTGEDISRHADRYASLLSVSPRTLLDAYYRIRPSYEALSDDVRILSWEDRRWPERIDGFPYAPRFLFLRGDLLVLERPMIALVGTRFATAEGKKLAIDTSLALGSKRFSLVSGLDLGIDGVVLRSSLQNGYGTVCVTGTKVDVAYPPEHQELQEEVAKEGLVVSRISPALSQQKWFFLLRNRLMSSLAEATVVIEEKDGGGAVGQALFALEEGRKVFIFKHQVDDASLSWPKDLAGKEGVIVVKDPSEIARHLIPKRVRKPKNGEQGSSGQLSLW